MCVACLVPEKLLPLVSYRWAWAYTGGWDVPNVWIIFMYFCETDPAGNNALNGVVLVLLHEE
jgi:hypothetical protein